MAYIFHDDSAQKPNRFSDIFLILFWLMGLVSGIVLFCKSAYLFLPLMRGIFRKSVSIVCLYCVSILPFVLSAFAVSFNRQLLLYPICFLKALSFTFVSGAVWVTSGSAGWLVWRLLMFCDVTSLPLLYWYCRRHISGLRSFSLTEFLLVASLVFLLGSIDYCCISPWLAML